MHSAVYTLKALKLVTPVYIILFLVTLQYCGTANGHSFRSLYCQYVKHNDSDHCHFGHYINECGHRSCYKGLGENCGVESDALQFGKCAPDLSCVCGKCSGCQNDHCSLELCKGHRFFDSEGTIIVDPYYY